MNDLKQHTFEIVRQLTGRGNLITTSVAYVDFMDGVEGGLFLSQLIYWSDRSTLENGYVYKTDKEWYKETRLSRHSVRKARKKLEDMGLLETKIQKVNGSPTTHYRLDKAGFVESFISFVRKQTMDCPKTDNGLYENAISSYTEITTETTADITNTSYVEEERVPYSEIVAYLNEKAGKSFKHTASDTRKLIQARWNEGHRLADFKLVIDAKTKKWKGSLEMDKYLRPSTLFAPKHFDNYRNEGLHNETYGTDFEEYDFNQETEPTF